MANALKTRETNGLQAKGKSQGQDLITPNWRQNAKITQKYGTIVKNLPIGIPENARQEVVARLNLLLADTITLRDLYKKSHWRTTLRPIPASSVPRLTAKRCRCRFRVCLRHTTSS
jgi:hypothetical protein